MPINVQIPLEIRLGPGSVVAYHEALSQTFEKSLIKSLQKGFDSGSNPDLGVSILP